MCASPRPWRSAGTASELTSAAPSIVCSNWRRGRRTVTSSSPWRLRTPSTSWTTRPLTLSRPSKRFPQRAVGRPTAATMAMSAHCSRRRWPISASPTIRRREGIGHRTEGDSDETTRVPDERLGPGAWRASLTSLSSTAIPVMLGAKSIDASEGRAC